MSGDHRPCRTGALESNHRQPRSDRFSGPEDSLAPRRGTRCLCGVATVLLPKDFVRLRLAGERATDVSDASGTLLLDLKTRSWSAEILEALEIDPQWLPSVFESSAQAGEVSRATASELGLGSGIPVAAGGGDNAAAAVGNGVVRPGLASCSIG